MIYPKDSKTLFVIIQLILIVVFVFYSSYPWNYQIDSGGSLVFLLDLVVDDDYYYDTHDDDKNYNNPKYGRMCVLRRSRITTEVGGGGEVGSGGNYYRNDNVGYCIGNI